MMKVMRLIPQVVLVLAAVAGLAIAASDVVLFERQTAPGAWACDEYASLFTFFWRWVFMCLHFSRGTADP